jgi:hypothetical protein
MLESIYHLRLLVIYLQVFTTESMLIAAVGIAIAVVVVLVVIVIVLRRRPHLRLGAYQPRHLPMFPQHTQSMTESSPTGTVLEMLNRDLEETSMEHAAGHIDRKEFYDRIAEIRKTLEDLRHFGELTAKSKNCSGCGAEIAKESQFCDRCGAKQQQSPAPSQTTGVGA